MPSNDWSDIEVELIVSDYFAMLKNELLGVHVNKTKHREAIISLLKGRSNGSVEFKHQNISAVLSEMGYPFIKGYKPLSNFQRSKLITAVGSYIKSDLDVEALFRTFSDTVPEKIRPIEFMSWIVPPPEISEVVKKSKPIRRPIKINYLEREQNNRLLGLKGEELALNYERYNLITAGKEGLADKVQWVSRDLGDGLGFDILSKYINGSDKYIEVKTTKLSKESPFYFSINEYNFSIENEANYHLYRIFNFDKVPQMFQLTGRYDTFCNIEPIAYKGSF